MEDKMVQLVDETLERTIKDGLTTNNLDIVYKLSKIKHMAKEDKNMNYGNYDNYGRDEYGTYDGYGARRRDSRGRFMDRGYDMKYRGDDSLDRMAGEYGRYMESRERYGAGEETDKSFHYMVKALEDFIMVLKEEAETPQQKQQLMQSLQNSMR